MAIVTEEPTRRRRGRYPREFRRDVAALVIDQRRTVADVARELDLVEQTVSNWVRQERIDRGQREGLSRRSAAASPNSSGWDRTAPVSARCVGFRASRPPERQARIQRSIVGRE
jgi:transposase-like protein